MSDQRWKPVIAPVHEPELEVLRLRVKELEQKVKTAYQQGYYAAVRPMNRAELAQFGLQGQGQLYPPSGGCAPGSRPDSSEPIETIFPRKVAG